MIVSIYIVIALITAGVCWGGMIADGSSEKNMSLPASVVVGVIWPIAWVAVFVLLLKRHQD